MGASFVKLEVEVLEDRIARSTLELNNAGAFLDFTPGPGVANHLFVSSTPTMIILYDEVEEFTNVPAGWVLSDGDHKVEGPRGVVTLIRAEDLGPENDFLDGSGSDIPLQVQGGYGDDTLTGGSGNDRLRGGEG